MTSEHSLKSRWKDKEIVILGKGYIGQQLQEFLTELDYSVSSVDHRALNYHDPITLSKYIMNNDISMVINCSGFTGRPNVDEAEHKKELCWTLNVESPVTIAKVCNQLDVKLIHISSGCIYSGYTKEFDELDVPNFGLFDTSSFYSKTKHAFETLTKNNDLKILRIRMPLCFDVDNPRNFLSKVLKYPNLIDYKNSKTFIPDLCGFIDTLINTDISWIGQDIYNIVNPHPLTTKELIKIWNNSKDIGNKVYPNWVSIEDLDIIAPRSNCVLNNDKASRLYDFHTEKEMLEKIINYN